MLKKWIYRKYTDDGCAVYACLSCKGEWEARTSPSFGKWEFCPLCGCKWDGGIHSSIVEDGRSARPKAHEDSKPFYILQAKVDEEDWTYEFAHPSEIKYKKYDSKLLNTFSHCVGTYKASVAKHKKNFDGWDKTTVHFRIIKTDSVYNGLVLWKYNLPPLIIDTLFK